MALIRWEPFREVESMQRQMNRLFDQVMSYQGEGDRSDGMSFVPAAEIHETDHEVKLRIEVPGIDAKDLDVNVTAEAVSIRGERRSAARQENGGMQRSEFRYGSFQRVIPLPARIRNDQIQAEFQNGVLCLTMPKAEDEKNRVVKVNLQGQNQQGQFQSDRQLDSQLDRQSDRQFGHQFGHQPDQGFQQSGSQQSSSQQSL